jgi:hypothetical protein
MNQILSSARSQTNPSEVATRSEDDVARPLQKTKHKGLLKLTTSHDWQA